MAENPNPLLEQVRETLVTFVRALRDRRTYPAQNPVVLRRRAELLAHLTALLGRLGELPLVVSADTLSWTGEAVYRSDDPRDSLAFTLYRQGVRELTFQRGVTEAEVAALVEALAAPLAGDEADDDLITLLWSADLRHIRYLAIEDATDGAAWARDPVNATRQLVDALPEVPAPASYQAAIRSLGTTYLAPVAEPPGLAMTAEDHAAHEQLAIEEGARDVTRDALDVILQVLESTTRPEAAQELTRVVVNIVEATLDARAFERTARLIAHLADLSGRDGAAAGALRTAREHFSDRAFMKRVVQRHNDALSDLTAHGGDSAVASLSARPLQEIVRHAGRATAPVWLELGCELQDKRLRRALCDAVAELSRGEVLTLATVSRAAKWHVSRNVAYVLGQTRDPAAMKLLRGLIEHPHEKVRIEALRAAAHVAPENAPDLVARAAVDRDRTVRLLALDLAFAAPSAQLVEALVVRVRTAQDVDSAERRATAITLGRIAGDAVTHLFRDMVVRRSLFGRAKIDDARVAGVAGLVAIDSPQAEEILAQVHRDDAAFGPVIQEARRAVARTKEPPTP